MTSHAICVTGYMRGDTECCNVNGNVIYCFNIIISVYLSIDQMFEYAGLRFVTLSIKIKGCTKSLLTLNAIKSCYGNHCHQECQAFSNALHANEEW